MQGAKSPERPFRLIRPSVVYAPQGCDYTHGVALGVGRPLIHLGSQDYHASILTDATKCLEREVII